MRPRLPHASRAGSGKSRRSATSVARRARASRQRAGVGRGRCSSRLTLEQVCGFCKGGAVGTCGSGRPRLGGGSVDKGGWPGKVETLAVVDTERAQEREVLVARDAFGHDRGSDTLSEADERRRERFSRRIARNLLRQAQIQFHEVGGEPKDVPKIREAGTDIVDCELRAAFS